MDRSDVERWLAAYRRAWETDDPQDIAALFTEDATYAARPFGKPWEGQDAIVAQWIQLGDSKNSWNFESEVVAIEGDTAVVRGLTSYPAHDDEPEEVYSNIWVIKLVPDGRARWFGEWWVERPKADRAAIDP